MSGVNSPFSPGFRPGSAIARALFRAALGQQRGIRSDVNQFGLEQFNCDIGQGVVKSKQAQPLESKCEGGFLLHHESAPASLIVLWTTMEGTRSALQTAGALAKSMQTHVTLILTEA